MSGGVPEIQKIMYEKAITVKNLKEGTRHGWSK